MQPPADAFPHDVAVAPAGLLQLQGRRRATSAPTSTVAGEMAAAVRSLPAAGARGAVSSLPISAGAAGDVALVLSIAVARPRAGARAGGSSTAATVAAAAEEELGRTQTGARILGVSLLPFCSRHWRGSNCSSCTGRDANRRKCSSTLKYHPQLREDKGRVVRGPGS